MIYGSGYCPKHTKTRSLTHKAKLSVIKTFLFASAWLIALFSVVFYGVDYFTTLRDRYLGLYLEWEKRIPYVPRAYLVYYSVFLLPFFVPVYVKSVSLIKAWAVKMSWCIMAAGGLFLLLPAKLGYPLTSNPNWEVIERITPIIIGRHNLVPSLHVALTYTIVATLWTHQRGLERAIFVSWAFLLSLSTLLTHAHHVLDVLAGLLLGFTACHYTGRSS
jgi:membrane-associated phospholipid phosphatase